MMNEQNPVRPAAGMAVAGAHPQQPPHGRAYAELINEKKYAEAEQAVARKLQEAPGDPDALAAKVELILVDGKASRFDEALSLAEQAVAAAPGRSVCHEALAMALGVLARQGGPFGAMRYAGRLREALSTAIELDPGNYRAQFFLLQFYLEAPDMLGGGMAKADALVAHTSRHDAGAGALLQARIDLHANRHERAAEGAIGASPGDSASLAFQQRELLMAIGQALTAQKKYDDAEQVYADLVRRYPEFYGGYFGIGRILQEQGRPEEAIASLENSLRLESRPGIHYRLGKSWQALGEDAKAIGAYEKSLSAIPAMVKSARLDAEAQLRRLR